MANKWFKFKQFTVWHDKCGMKVGTDGVLLGAWADVDGVKNVLDVGAGTGLIALMIAQRNAGCKIDAVEIEYDAFGQTKENFLQSPWSERLNCINLPVQDFCKDCTKQYDLIVSNPPFFTTIIKAPDEKRAMARHADTLPFADLLKVASQLLNDRGKLAVVLPVEMRSGFLTETIKNNFWVHRQTMVRPFPDKSPVRVLIEASKNKIENIKLDELTIRESPGGNYTSEFRLLTKDFYLAF